LSCVQGVGHGRPIEMGLPVATWPWFVILPPVAIFPKKTHHN
jgi:hypothetical protein